MKLGSVSEGELRSLLGHSAADFGHSMADVDHCRLASRVEKFASILGKEPAAFATDGERERLLKVARKESGVACHACSLSDCNRLASLARREQKTAGASKTAWGTRREG